MYSSIDVANSFLELAEKEGESVRTMKLLKLTYIAHGFHLGFFNEPFFNEKIEAWRYGPVIPELYYLIKGFGTYNVPKESMDAFTKTDLDKNSKKFVSSIWDAYKKFTGYQLSGLTHKEKSPWYQVYEKSGANNLIPNSIIKEYYKTLIRDKKIG